MQFVGFSLQVSNCHNTQFEKHLICFAEYSRLTAVIYDVYYTNSFKKIIMYLHKSWKNIVDLWRASRFRFILYILLLLMMLGLLLLWTLVMLKTANGKTKLTECDNLCSFYYYCCSIYSNSYLTIKWVAQRRKLVFKGREIKCRRSDQHTISIFWFTPTYIRSYNHY